MRIKLGLFLGGKSVEHEVSIISALQAANAFDKQKYEIIPLYISKSGTFYTGGDLLKIEEYRDIPALLNKSQQVTLVNENGVCTLLRYPLKRFGNPVAGSIDMAFPVVHGTNVEDGALQGYLKTLGVPFAGCDVTASALGMDKFAMKTVLKENHIPVLDCRKVHVKEYYSEPAATTAALERAFPYPLICKPLNLGSSIGIQKAANSTELTAALEYAFQFANTALVEPAIVSLKEINCAVLGDRNQVKISECEEPVNADAILSYQDKYMAQGKTGGSSKGMSGAKRIIPANISPEMREKVRTLAGATFQALDCNGVARIDFLLDTDSDTLYVNEINTIPGSLSFYLWEPVGLTYTALLDEIVDLAWARERANQEISYSFDTSILSQFQGGGLKGYKTGS